MKRLLVLTCIVSVAIATTTALAIDQPVLKWTQTPGSSSSIYYINGNVDGDAALAGHIGFGARMFDSDGNELNSLSLSGLSPNNGAKSLARIGDYYYITDSSGGIGRFDATGANAWSGASWAPTPTPAVVNPGSTAPESITTDGTWLFTNDDVNRDHIHAYSITNTATSFILTEEWVADLDPSTTNGRVRGLSYDAGSGYLYMHNGGATGTGNDKLYAIDASNGTVTQMGNHTEGGYTYQTLRYGDELLVVGYSDNLSVYDLTSDTAIAAGGPTQQFDLGLDNLYGVTFADSTLFVASVGGKISGFEMVPEPGTLVLLGLGGLFLGLTRSRRRRR